MSAMLLIEPLVSFDTIGIEDMNRCLVAWGHKMGPLNRPGMEAWFYGLRSHGKLVAVTAASRLPAETCGGFTRDQALELSRICAIAPDWCRVALRLWRQTVFPLLCRARGYQWAISYQDSALHSGDLYRFDGWVRIAFSHSGTDRRSGRAGRDKWIWAWCDDVAVLSERRSAAQTEYERTKAARDAAVSACNSAQARLKKIDEARANWIMEQANG